LTIRKYIVTIQEFATCKSRIRCFNCYVYMVHVNDGYVMETDVFIWLWEELEMCDNIIYD